MPNLKMLTIRRLSPCLVLLALTLSSCATTITDKKFCTVNGILSAGGICSHLLSPDTESLTLDQFLYFLEAQPASTPDHPAKAAAICTSADDFNSLKTSLEELCRMLGDRCSYQMRFAIANFGSAE